MRYLDALHKLVDGSGLNSDQRQVVKDTLTLEHGNDDEKADAQGRIDAASEDEVKRLEAQLAQAKARAGG